jgi:hypothetical protein
MAYFPVQKLGNRGLQGHPEPVEDAQIDIRGGRMRKRENAEKVWRALINFGAWPATGR